MQRNADCGLHLRVGLLGGRDGPRLAAAEAVVDGAAAVLLVLTAPHRALEARVPVAVLVRPALAVVELWST